MRLVAVFQDLSVGNWGDGKSNKLLANTSHYFLIFPLMSVADCEAHLDIY